MGMRDPHSCANHYAGMGGEGGLKVAGRWSFAEDEVGTLTMILMTRPGNLHLGLLDMLDIWPVWVNGGDSKNTFSTILKHRFILATAKNPSTIPYGAASIPSIILLYGSLNYL